MLDALAAAPPEERLRYTRQVVQILRDFPDRAVIQHKGCVALEAICRAQHGNAVRVQAAGAVPVVLVALDEHLRVRAVQHAGLGVIACLAKLAKQQIFDLGGISIILASMNKFKRDPVVQVSGSMALAAVCLNSSRNRQSVARYGGISALLDALQRHPLRTDVLVAAGETLAQLADADAGLRQQMLSSLPVVQGLLARYEQLGTSAGVPGVAGEVKAPKPKDVEIVLRSLRRLEGLLYDGAYRSGAGAEIRGHALGEVSSIEVGATPVSVTASKAESAQELHEKIKRWSTSKKHKKAGG